MFITVEEALKVTGEGAMLVIADDGGPDASASLFVAAERASADAVRFMAAHGGVPVCAVAEETNVETLWLPAGMPLVKTVPGGVLRKAGHAEAAVDMAHAAGFMPAGVYCGLPDTASWQALAEANHLKIVTIESLIAWRRERDVYVTLEAEANLPTAWGLFRMAGFVNRLNGEHHVALVMGDVAPGDAVLIRVHSECLTGDVFHSLKCDCGEQLAAAMDAIERDGKGILLYLRQEGRGIGLINKIKAYKLQEQGLDTEEANLALGFPADMRDYGIGAQILSALGATRLRVMTNNPKKLVGIRGHGIEVVERVPIVMEANEYNRRYFQTKREKMGHLF